MIWNSEHSSVCLGFVVAVISWIATSSHVLFPHSTMPSGQQPQKHYGITSAISLAPPREIDHQYTKKLCDAMKPFGVFEDEEELNHRWEITNIII